ncbi:hypothetical protein FRC17_008684, partial [Serendipita sp. 399]
GLNTALSPDDNHYGMNIVAWDMERNLVKQLDKPGARYIWKITFDSASQTVTFTGQSSKTVHATLDELIIPPSVVHLSASAAPVLPYTLTYAAADPSQFPVIKTATYSFWPASYKDGRNSFAVVVVDRSNQVQHFIDCPGGQVIQDIQINNDERTIVLHGQNDSTATFDYDTALACFSDHYTATEDDFLFLAQYFNLPLSNDEATALAKAMPIIDCTMCCRMVGTYKEEDEREKRSTVGMFVGAFLGGALGAFAGFLVGGPVGVGPGLMAGSAIGIGIGKAVPSSSDLGYYQLSSLEKQHSLVGYLKFPCGPFTNTGISENVFDSPFPRYESLPYSAALIRRSEASPPRAYSPATKSIGAFPRDPRYTIVSLTNGIQLAKYIFVIIKTDQSVDGKPGYQMRINPEDFFSDTWLAGNRVNHSQMSEGYRFWALMGHPHMQVYAAGSLYLDLTNQKLLGIDTRTGHYFRSFIGQDQAVNDATLGFLANLGYPTTVLISPRSLEDVYDVYSEESIDVTPLLFHEANIKFRHILSLFQPPSGNPGSARITNSINHIVNQLRRSFDLQRFIELVDEEKWDDDGATFVALRQTILTELVSGNSVKDNSLFSRSREILVDLTDPLLSATGFDGVILDMALHRFLAANKNRKKLLVLSPSVGSIQRHSCLFESLNRLASQGQSRDTSVVIGTLEPSTLSPIIFNALDYVMCGSIRHPAWRRSFLDTVGIDIDFASLKPGELAIVCCGHSDIKLSMAVETLSRSTPRLVDHGYGSPDNHRSSMAVLPADTLSLYETSKSTSTSTRLSPEPPDSEAITSDATRSSTGSTKSSLDGLMRSNEIKAEMTEDLYPEHFRPLMRAILKQCNSQVGVEVKFDALREALGSMKQFTSLGWSNLTVWVKAACTAGFLTREGKGKSRLIRLRPLTLENSHIDVDGPRTSVSTNNSLQVVPFQVLLGDYPREHYGLVAAVLRLTSGRALVKVQYHEVKEVMKDAGKDYSLSDASLIHMLAQASRAGIISYGRGNDRIWIRLEGPQIQKSHSASSEAAENALAGKERFSLLLTVLNLLREKHKIDYPPITLVAETLVSMAPDVFRKAGFASISEYLGEAERIGVVTTVDINVNNAVVERIMASHTHIAQGRTLVLHATKSLLRGCSSPVPAVPTKNSESCLIVSPRDPEEVSYQYLDVDRPLVKLAVNEADIEIRHILGFFTPPLDTSGRHRILTRVHHIVNQLSAPFDLQRFNELVDAEKWDDDTATFMALRQTILTQLISSEHETLNSIIQTQQEVVVDLSDSLLSEIGLDEVVMDIVLSVFLHYKDKPSLIVINNAQDFLHSQSILSSSLASLTRQDTYRRSQILISTIDPAVIPSTLFSGLRFCFCGHSSSPLWRRSLADRLDIPFDLGKVTKGEVALICPISGDVSSIPDDLSSDGSLSYLFVKVEDLRQTARLSATKVTAIIPPETGHPLQPDTDMNSSEVGNSLRIPLNAISSEANSGVDCPSNLRPLLNAVISLCGGLADFPVKYKDVRKRVDQEKDPQAAAWSSFLSMVQAACDEGLIEHRRVDGADYIFLISHNKPLKFSTHPSTSLKEPSGSGTSSLGSTPPPPHSTAPPATDDYPPEFKPFMRTVISMSNGSSNVRLDYLDVRKQLGNNNTIKSMGWPSFTQLVKSACERGYIHCNTSGTDTFISLKPLQEPTSRVGSLQTHARLSNLSPSRTPLFGEKSDISKALEKFREVIENGRLDSLAEKYPLEYRTLMAAIINLSGGRPRITVKYEDVRSKLGTRAQINVLGWSSFSAWVKSASEKGFIRTGGTGETQWIMLKATVSET